jgi:hypothetical protein
VQLGRSRGRTHLVLDGRLEAQQLLDGRGRARRLVGQQGPLLGMVGQGGERVADEVGDRLGPRYVEQDA